MAQGGLAAALTGIANLIQANDFAIFPGLVWNVHFLVPGRRDMPTILRSTGRKLWQTMSSIKTGVVLLIVVVIFAAAGTVILQRPTTDAEDIRRAYSPPMLRILDSLGLTDVFHSWWFVLLLLLVSMSIIAASIQRFPNSWRFFSRPYKSPDESFRKNLATQTQIPIDEEAAALATAEKAFRDMGFHPQHVQRNQQQSIFGERSRFSEMAVYIVHASLLLIFMGGIIDALYGWRGYVALTQGQQSNNVELHDKSGRHLPFSVRCDAAGQENYQDGTPKKWWSKLAVIEDGREVMRKEIVVNDPLVYRGVRFYQSSYGSTGKLEKLVLTASPVAGAGPARDIALALNETVALDPETTVRMTEFIPDYVVSDGQVYTRSTQVDNPAAHLVLTAKGKSVNVWLPPIPGFAENDKSSYRFEGKDLQMAYFTGLEVSHEPGQWAVWAGVLLMAAGLASVFYMVHVRLWAVVVRDARGGLTLWVGGTANKNKDVFEERFQELMERIRRELKAQAKPRSSEPVASLAGD
jgi:cytochrome c biogenesis protein